MIKHVIISGRVQGVGFRHFTNRNAKALGLKGWVRNLPDGKVEAIFEGEEPAVLKMLELCKKGPVGSYVADLKEIPFKEDAQFNSFVVKY